MIEYAALVCLAILPIHLGSIASVKNGRKTAKSEAKDGNEQETDDEAEVLTAKDAMWIPVVAGVVLCTLFLAFKYLDKALLNKILGYYFAGAVRMFACLHKLGVGRRAYASLERYKLELHSSKETLFKLRFTKWHIVFTFASLVLTIANEYTKHFLLANLFGIIFSFNAISLVKLDSFKTGFIMLMGLFFYDIYFVFGTKVMVTVAQSVEAPIKMVWPKDASNPSTSGLAMLGLGDIAVPGLFIALALRFDYFLSTKKQNAPQVKVRASYSKPYYTSTLVSYLFGLFLTIWIMHTFKHAQPALLYLSPACCLSVIFCAAARGELSEMWNFIDGADSTEKLGENPAKRTGDTRADNIPSQCSTNDNANSDPAESNATIGETAIDNFTSNDRSHEQTATATPQPSELRRR